MNVKQIIILIVFLELLVDSCWHLVKAILDLWQEM